MEKDKKEIPFSEWLAKDRKVTVRDFDETRVPRWWRKFKHVNGLGVRGKDVYLRGLDKMPERPKARRLLHETDHTDNQKRKIWIIWLARYTFIPRSRRRQEVSGYTRNMEERYIQGNTFDNMPEKYAEYIIDHYFLSDRQKKKHYPKALKELQENWKKIQNGSYTEVADLRERWMKETGQL